MLALIHPLSLCRFDPVSGADDTGREMSEQEIYAGLIQALGIETSDAVLQGLVNLDVYGLPEDSLDTYRSRIRAVTAADVERLASKLLHPDRAAIVLVGPAEALTPQLKDLGPIEVVQP